MNADGELIASENSPVEKKAGPANNYGVVEGGNIRCERCKNVMLDVQTNKTAQDIFGSDECREICCRIINGLSNAELVRSKAAIAHVFVKCDVQLKLRGPQRQYCIKPLKGKAEAFPTDLAITFGFPISTLSAKGQRRNPKLRSDRDGEVA